MLQSATLSLCISLAHVNTVTHPRIKPRDPGTLLLLNMLLARTRERLVHASKHASHTLLYLRYI